MNTKIEILKERLKKYNISHSEKTIENAPSRLNFEIPAGRDKYDCILICREGELDYAIATDFEKYNFIQHYEAIWSKENQIIEVELSSQTNILRRLHRYMTKVENNDNEDNETIAVNEIPDNITLPNIKDLEISIGKCSPTFSLLSTSRERGLRRFDSGKITLKIKNINKHTHDSVKEMLEKVSNALFFQIDLAYELPIKLQDQRESFLERYKRRNRKQNLIDENAIISEPKYEYDPEPMTLYWNAKETAGIPIFQFLAYYQTIEYYFPIYSNYDAKQKIQNIIKDPRFNPNKDTDITKIINSIKTNTAKGFGNEREQLKSTISYSITNEDLRDFFNAEESRLNFYMDHKGKNLCLVKIPIKSESADLIADVSERIYQLRCRIVHSKISENDVKILLPYSSEVKLLNFDIDLIEFIARKVLINSSRPLTL